MYRVFFRVPLIVPPGSARSSSSWTPGVMVSGWGTRKKVNSQDGHETAGGSGDQSGNAKRLLVSVIRAHRTLSAASVYPS